MTDGAGSDKKSPVEQAVDVFLYAPLGLALEVRNLLPQLVERGRQQVTLARMVGHFAVQKGQSDATKVIGRAGEQANAVLTDLGLVNRESEAAEPAPSAPPDPSPLAVAPGAPPAMARSSEKSSGLAIADYDSLAASQVIPRLPGLSSEELEAVRNYEAVNRGRKTVLNRIAQLQSA
jgi:hypothetical protein